MKTSNKQTVAMALTACAVISLSLFQNCAPSGSFQPVVNQAKNMDSDLMLDEEYELNTFQAQSSNSNGAENLPVVFANKLENYKRDL